MFTIIGSGFGLYAYLPALIEAFRDAVVLPARYQTKFDSRPELQPYRSWIKWVSHDDEALVSASGVVIATTPAEQPLVAARCLESGRIATLFLEKPLARTPKEASDLVGRLSTSGRRYRIGYTLLHARWAAAMDRFAGPESGAMTITWHFMAHHFRTGLESWKSKQSAGGGVIRFFGIHLLPLLARQGYRTVEQSTVSGLTSDQPDRWQATFSGPGLPPCNIDVDSNSSCARFALLHETPDDHGMPVDLSEPFELEGPIGHALADRRVAVLMRLLATLQLPDEPHYRLYAIANDLWRQAEEKSAAIERNNPPARSDEETG